MKIKIVRNIPRSFNSFSQKSTRSRARVQNVNSCSERARKHKTSRKEPTKNREIAYLKYIYVNLKNNNPSKCLNILSRDERKITRKG